MNKKSSILILERDINRINFFDLNFKNKVLNYKIAKNMNDFYDLLISRPWDFIFIENDLVQGEPLSSSDLRSGYNALPVINENYQFKDSINTIVVHTANPVAIQNMNDYVYINNMEKVIFNPFNSSEFKATVVKIQKYLSDNEY